MENISERGKPLPIIPFKQYVIIDALYLATIKEALLEGKEEDHGLDGKNFEEEVREKVFAHPFTDIPFAKFYSRRSVFWIEQIKGVEYDEIKEEKEKARSFACDSGLIAFFEETLFLEFVKAFQYDELTTSVVDVIDRHYWYEFVKSFPLHETGLIMAPGIDSGFDLEGSGLFQVIHLD